MFENAPSTILTSALNTPSVESYLSRCDACFTPPLSLMATTSSRLFSRPIRHRRKLRPMRPKPLIATFIFFCSAVAATTFLRETASCV